MINWRIKFLLASIGLTVFQATWCWPGMVFSMVWVAYLIGLSFSLYVTGSIAYDVCVFYKQNKEKCYNKNHDNH